MSPAPILCFFMGTLTTASTFLSDRCLSLSLVREIRAGYDLGESRGMATEDIQVIHPVRRELERDFFRGLNGSVRTDFKRIETADRKDWRFDIPAPP